MEFVKNFLVGLKISHSTFGPFDFIHFPLHVSDLNYVEEIKGYTVSNHGRAVLVDQRNYTYSVNKKKANRTFWVCSYSYRHKKCKARASTCGNYIMKLSGTHNHEPNNIDKILKSQNDPLKKD